MLPCSVYIISINGCVRSFCSDSDEPSVENNISLITKKASAHINSFTTEKSSSMNTSQPKEKVSASTTCLSPEKSTASSTENFSSQLKSPPKEKPAKASLSVVSQKEPPTKASLSAISQDKSPEKALPTAISRTELPIKAPLTVKTRETSSSDSDSTCSSSPSSKLSTLKRPTNYPTSALTQENSDAGRQESSGMRNTCRVSSPTQTSRKKSESEKSTNICKPSPGVAGDNMNEQPGDDSQVRRLRYSD